MDMTGRLEFFVDGLSTQIAEFRERGEQAIRKDVIVKEHNLSDRQALALSHVLVHDRVSIQDFERLALVSAAAPCKEISGSWWTKA